MVCSDTVLSQCLCPAQPLPPSRALQPQEAAWSVGLSVCLPGEGIKKKTTKTPALPVICLAISCCILISELRTRDVIIIILITEIGVIAHEVIWRAGSRAGSKPQAFCNLDFALPVKRYSPTGTKPAAEIPACTFPCVWDLHRREPESRT